VVVESEAPSVVVESEAPLAVVDRKGRIEDEEVVG
jgi:hypothetical protein